MLLGISQIVREKIVVILGEWGALPASEILSQVRPRTTKQALYQELRKLIEDGVVIKVGQLYALRFAWVLRLGDLTAKMYGSVLRNADVLWLPTDRKKRWVLSNLRQALQIWSHLSMILFRTEERKTLFEYVPHAWYHLVNTEVEQQFQEILRHERIKFYLIVGDDTFLDRSYERFFAMSGYKIAFGHRPFKVDDSEYFSVIGDVMIRVTLSKHFVQYLDQLFCSVRRWGSTEVSEIGKVLSISSKICVEVSRNPVKARRLTKKFEEFF